ncbi:MAG: hypothetical protein ACP5I7_07115 [Sulfolobales archaeon]
MAFRAYDPCFACGTHAVPGGLRLVLEFYNERGEFLYRKDLGTINASSCDL